jgi:hypothetical protein
MPPVRPTCLALVLCDAVERDASGRATLSGVFQAITVGRFPAKYPPFCVWLQVTNGHGALSMSLRLDHVPSDRIEIEPVAEARFSLRFDDPRQVLEYATRWDRIHLDHEGDYRMTLLADDTAIMHRYLVATRLP